MSRYVRLVACLVFASCAVFAQGKPLAAARSGKVVPSPKGAHAERVRGQPEAPRRAHSHPAAEVPRRRARASAPRRVHQETTVARPRGSSAAPARVEPPRIGQSIGAPWQGKLAAATRLRAGTGYVLRRAARAWGTATAVAHIRAALRAFREAMPKTHVVAIGDLSARAGGQISQHASHQSGRDVDIGLVYKRKPRGFPEMFVDATEANLDPRATYELLRQFVATAGTNGGAAVIFLDYRVQGWLYKWAHAHGIDEAVLRLTFQYPRGRDATALVRHIPNHLDHMHVRFACPAADRQCE